MINLQRPEHERAVPEEAPGEGLFDLHRLDRGQSNRRRAAPKGSMHDDDVLSCHDEVRSLPAPDRDEGDEGCQGEEAGAGRGEGPASKEEDQAERRQEQRLRERRRKHDAVAANLEQLRLATISSHGGGFGTTCASPLGLNA